MILIEIEADSTSSNDSANGLFKWFPSIHPSLLIPSFFSKKKKIKIVISCRHFIQNRQEVSKGCRVTIINPNFSKLKSQAAQLPLVLREWFKGSIWPWNFDESHSLQQISKAYYALLQDLIDHPKSANLSFLFDFTLASQFMLESHIA